MSKTVAYGLIEVQKDTYDSLSRAASFPFKNGNGAVFLVASLHGMPNSAPKLRELFLDEILLHLDGLAGESMTPGEAEHRFEDSMQKLNDVLKSWLETHPDAVDLPRSGVMALILVGNSLLVTGFGQVHSVFFHTPSSGADEAHDIVRDLRRERVPDAAKLFRHVMMGEFEPGDRAVFGNSAAFRLLPKLELTEIVASLPAASSGEQLKLAAEAGIESVVGVVLRAAIATAPARILAKHSVEELHRAETRTEEVLTQKPERIGRTFGAILASAGSGAVKCLQFLLGLASSLGLVLWGSMKTVALLGWSSKRATAKQDYHRLLHHIREHLSKKAAELSLGLKVAFALSVVAAFAIVFLVHRGTERQALARDRAHLESVLGEIKTAEGDAEARIIYHDEAGAKTKIDLAAMLLDSNAAILTGHPALAELTSTLERMRGELRKEKTLTLAPVVTLPEPALRLFVIDGEAYSVSQTGMLYHGAEVAAKTGKTVSNAVLSDHSMYLFDSTGGLLKVSSKGELKPIDATAPTDLSAATFWTNRIYALQPSSGNVLRFDAVSGGFSKPRAWQKGENAKLHTARSITIDADVYVATPDEVIKYSLGVEQTWAIGAVEPALHDVKRIWTSPETNSLYVLDAGSRVAVFSKSDGALMAQYLIPGAVHADDFAVDLANKILYFLSGSTVTSAKIE